MTYDKEPTHEKTKAIYTCLGSLDTLSKNISQNWRYILSVFPIAPPCATQKPQISLAHLMAQRSFSNSAHLTQVWNLHSWDWQLPSGIKRGWEIPELNRAISKSDSIRNYGSHPNGLVLHLYHLRQCFIR